VRGIGSYERCVAVAAAVVLVVGIAAAGEGDKGTCPIAGLSKYMSEITRDDSNCSLPIYIRACAAAEVLHRQRCQEFCGAFKTRDGIIQCEGNSSPYSELFDPDTHCKETPRSLFNVTCRVTSDCTCEPVESEVLIVPLEP